MYVQPQLQLKPQKKVKLTPIEIWWANLLPPQVKAIMPHWSISALIVSAMGLIWGSPMAITLVSLFWASMIFTLAFRALRPVIGRHKWIIPAYHALLFAFVANPAFAQAADQGAVCANNGLFSRVTEFVVIMFGNVGFVGTGASSLSALVCQVVGLLTIGLVLGFLGVLGTVSYQVGYQRQPIATVLDPLFGFLIFAGGSTFVISVMLGTATTATT